MTDEGNIALPRSDTDRWIVDYSPALLFKWAGHAHVHILKTLERRECSPNAILYIVKYNFKDESSFRVEVGKSDSCETLFHARVVSSEEAIARIFSFQALFTTMDVSFVTCASTSIAASLINGQTLHSNFGLFTDRDDITHCSLDIWRPRGYAISLCNVILIDEITMISRSVLEALDAGLGRLAAQARHPSGDMVVTAHKSQGQSLARVAIDMAEPAFAHGPLYVALSRVRSLDAVRLFGRSEFPENGPFFHINRYIMAREPDQGINDF